MILLRLLGKSQLSKLFKYEGNIKTFNFQLYHLRIFMIIWRSFNINIYLFINLLSHPSILGVTLCFVPYRTPPPPPAAAADSCSRDNFWTIYWISFIFGTIVGPDLLITWLDFGRFSSWPWPWIFKVKYRICYISAKNGPIATKRKANTSN